MTQIQVLARFQSEPNRLHDMKHLLNLRARGGPEEEVVLNKGLS